MTNATQMAEDHTIEEENAPAAAEADSANAEDTAKAAEGAGQGDADEATAEAAGKGATVTHLGDPHAQALRMTEALLFAAAEPLDKKSIAQRLPEGTDVDALLDELKQFYAPRGVNLVQVGGKWLLRTAEDLSFLLQREAVQQKRLSRPAMETLAIIAYHQPVTRAEIEEIRGVHVSKGTLDVLMETGWIRPRGRRRTPGRPLTFGTSDDFLVHFGLETLRDLPGMDDLKAAGLLDARLPPDFKVPTPGEENDNEDEDPLAEDDTGEEFLVAEADAEAIAEMEAEAEADAEASAEEGAPESEGDNGEDADGDEDSDRS